MTITNKHQLPEGIVKAVTTERHNKTDKELSATTLLKGIKEIILTNRHWDKLTDDVADRIWAIFGTAVHSLLEHEGKYDFSECLLDAIHQDIRITGKIDNYNMETGTVTDYKTASVWKVIVGDLEDWRMQGLIYAWLLNKSDLRIEKCRFVAILKDHSKSKAKYDSSYPQSPVFIYEFPVSLKEFNETETFINERISMYKKNMDKPDDEIPPCTDKERWASETEYVVMKTGNKRAVKKFTNIIDAQKMATEKGVGHYVETRPGVSKKCAEYCLCCDYCNFYNNFVKNQTIEE